MKNEMIWVYLRLTMGFIFIWAFADKLWGLGFATPPDSSWMQGASPTNGYLAYGTTGIFASFFSGLAGNAFIDWIFMTGLLLVGLSLLLGIGVRIAGYSGSLMMFLIYLSAFPPQNNPVIDEHIVYILVLIGLTTSRSGNRWGLGAWWARQKLVKQWPLLQ